MSSDSELSQSGPDDALLEQTLRDIVRKGDIEPVTINTVRAAAEDTLGLESGFFKKHADWKEKSKNIISDAFNEPASQRSPSPVPSPPKPSSKPKAQPPKRASTDNVQKSRKRQKRAVPESDESDAVESQDVSEDIGVTSKPAADDSESEMSVVLDEEPPKRRRQKSASADTKSKAKAKPKAKATKTSKASADASKDLSPDEAEIKRLQGWLLKCGIRKLWHRELAPYDNPKAKIKHLKEMLREVGMEGRYSEQKASKIKEERELAAELEAVQEGAKQWGNQNDGSSEEEEVRPKRRGAAANFVDFGDNDDDDEDEDD